MSVLKGLWILIRFWWGPKVKFERHLGYEYETGKIRRMSYWDHNKETLFSLQRRSIIPLMVVALAQSLFQILSIPYYGFIVLAFLIPSILFALLGSQLSHYTTFRYKGLMADVLLVPDEELPRLLTSDLRYGWMADIVKKRLEGAVDDPGEVYRRFVSQIDLGYESDYLNLDTWREKALDPGIQVYRGYKFTPSSP